MKRFQRERGKHLEINHLNDINLFMHNEIRTNLATKVQSPTQMAVTKGNI